MFVLPGYKFRHNVFINAENHGFHAVNTETDEHGLNTEVDWVMHGSITKWTLSR